MENYSLLRFIPLIPLLGTAVNIFFGARLGRKNAGLLACAAVGLSFLISLYLLAPARERAFQGRGFYLDRLAPF